MGSWESHLYEQPSEKLEEFIQNYLRPSEDCQKDIDQSVDTICAVLQEPCQSLTVTGVAKGGSYGRRTVLRGNSDGILVVFFRDLEQFQDQEKRQYELLGKIWARMKHCESTLNLAAKMELQNTNRSSRVTVQLSTKRQSIAFNVLPAFNPLDEAVSACCLAASSLLCGLTKPRFPENQKFCFSFTPGFGEKSSPWSYRELKRSLDTGKHVDPHMSDHICKVPSLHKGGSTAKGTALKTGSDASLVVFADSLKSYTSPKNESCNIIKEIHEQLEACQQQKDFECESKLKQKGSLPPKYALELLTIYAWEKGSGAQDFDTAEGFRTVLEFVIQYQHLCVFWTVNYSFDDEILRNFLLTQIQRTRRSGVAGRRAEAGKAVKPSGVEVRSLRVRGPAGGLQNFRSSESLASEKRTAALNKCSFVSEHEKSAANREETRVDP
ncbi:hypothetical protein K5549_007266 [Capra hircus]|nr:hypothetical protein K5549_007266 [Capra hircus]